MGKLVNIYFAIISVSDYCGCPLILLILVLRHIYRVEINFNLLKLSPVKIADWFSAWS